MSALLRPFAAASFAVALALGFFVAAPTVEAAGSMSRSAEPTAAEDFEAARADIAANRYRDAIGKLERADENDPNNPDILNYLAFANRKLGALETAAGYYERALAIDPDHVGALQYQGELYVHLGDMEAARANLERLEGLCGSACEETQELAALIFAAENGDDLTGFDKMGSSW